jgi:hypothetical protein
MIHMPPTLEAEADARKAAEAIIVGVLQKAEHPIRLQDLIEEISKGSVADLSTARRAVWRLAASGRAVLGRDLALSLGK